MDIVTGQNKINTENIPFVKDAWCSFLSNKINIHLSCDEGDEKHVFNNLPKWVHDEMEVTKSHTHLILSNKK